MTEHKKTVAVDFDGVIHEYGSKWKGDAVIEDEPVAGAIEWLHSLTDTFEVIICSSRAGSEAGRDAICRWLEKHDAPPDLHVTCRKPPAILYIDDRAYHFDGTNFPDPDAIANFKPWNRRSWERL